MLITELSYGLNIYEYSNVYREEKQDCLLSRQNYACLYGGPNRIADNREKGIKDVSKILIMKIIVVLVWIVYVIFLVFLHQKKIKEKKAKKRKERISQGWATFQTHPRRGVIKTSLIKWFSYNKYIDNNLSALYNIKIWASPSTTDYMEKYACSQSYKESSLPSTNTDD